MAHSKEPRIYTCADVCEKTGISRRHVARLAAAGKIPGAYRVDGVHFAFPDSKDLREWMKTHRLGREFTYRTPEPRSGCRRELTPQEQVAELYKEAQYLAGRAEKLQAETARRIEMMRAHAFEKLAKIGQIAGAHEFPAGTLGRACRLRGVDTPDVQEIAKFRVAADLVAKHGVSDAMKIAEARAGKR